MTPEKVIELANQARIAWDDTDRCTEYRVGLPELQAFAQLVRNEALEEAANHCQACSIPPPGGIQTDGQFAALHLSQQIRGLKS